MNRQEFIKELSYLLQDMPEDEKAEAVQYYEDYFEDAGEEKEAAVIAELGSPEKVAAMIRFGDSGEQSEYTERGYENPNYRGPVYEVGNHTELPAGKEKTESAHAYDLPPRRHSIMKILLLIVVFVFASPLVLGIGGGILGILCGALGILLALAVSVGVVTVALLFSGVVCIVGGIIKAFINPVVGVFMIAAGFVLTGLGLLGLILSAVVYGRFIPGVFRSFFRMISRLFHRNYRGGETA